MTRNPHLALMVTIPVQGADSIAMIVARMLIGCGWSVRKYISVGVIHNELIHMESPETEEKEFSDEELEEIIDMKAPTELVKEFEAMVKESPLARHGVGICVWNSHRRLALIRS